MIESMQSTAARLASRVNSRGWIALGLAAGMALAFAVSRRQPMRRTRRPDLGPWQGERSRPVDANAAAAS